MDEGLGPSRAPKTIDYQHLGLLSLFHFVGAGLALLGLGFVFLHWALMSSVMDPANWQGREGAPPDGFFDIFKWFYVVLGGWMGASLVLNLLAAVYLRAKKHRIFCIVVAAWNCLHTPIGTLLGIFTIIVLARNSVRTLFDRQNYGIAHVE